MGLFTFILGFCAVLISALGAGFSVHGLASLFSGAFVAVAVMAGALELGKLVIAAFLHTYWSRLNFFLRSYLTAATVTLMCITSLGIFGFLSNSYQVSSMDINRLQIQITSAEQQYARANSELERMYKLIEEIPTDQSTRKLQMQKRFEPLIAEYSKKANDAQSLVSNLKLEQLQSHSKVGPLIYVAKAFDTDIDHVVKWLIVVFVLVFDPLAVCLVIATSSTIKFRAADAAAAAVASAKKKTELEAAAPVGESLVNEPTVADLSDGEIPERKSA
jgi:hypothetical protein